VLFWYFFHGYVVSVANPAYMICVYSIIGSVKVAGHQQDIGSPTYCLVLVTLTTEQQHNMSLFFFIEEFIIQCYGIVFLISCLNLNVCRNFIAICFPNYSKLD